MSERSERIIDTVSVLDAATVARLGAVLPGEGEVLAVAPEGAGGTTRRGGWTRPAARGSCAWPMTEPVLSVARAVRREVAVMQLVRRRLGGWAAETVVVDEGCLAYRRVPGVPLQDLLVRGAIARPQWTRSPARSAA